MRRFRAVFGESALQLSMRARLQHARLLPACNGESVIDVCLRLGYSSPATFSVVFKRQTGKSPARYRRRFWPAGGFSNAVPSNFQLGCISLFEMAWASVPEHFSISGKPATMTDWSNDKLIRNIHENPPQRLNSIMVDDQKNALGSIPMCSAS